MSLVTTSNFRVRKRPAYAPFLVLTFAPLYQRRWQIELFFKWIKPHLRLKAFFGTSDNADKTHVWMAIGVYVLGAMGRKKLRLELSLSPINLF